MSVVPVTKVVVVGGFGFIGQAVLNQLISKNFEIIVIDNLSAPVSSAPAKFPTIKFVNGDIADPTFAPSLDIRHAIWIQLAAVPFIPDTFLNPWKAVHTNLLGTLRACRIAAAAQALRFVYISTSEVYGPSAPGTGHLSETSPTAPWSVYAISKLAAESVVREFRELPWVILRPFNCFGPNATHPYFIPEMIRQSIKKDEIRVGNLETARDFTYVADTADAIARSIETAGIEGMTINVCSGKARRMADILALIQAYCNANTKPIVADPSRFRPAGTDPEVLVGDGGKAKAHLIWQPQVSFETGLRLTVEEYLKCGEWPYEAANTVRP